MVKPAPGSKGSSEAVLRRKDGSTLILDRSGKVLKETNPEGKTVIRLDVTRSKSGGVSSSKKITSQKDNFLSKEVQAVQEENANINRENARLLRVGNISLDGGGVGRVDYTFTDPNAMSKGNESKILNRVNINKETFSFKDLTGFIPPEQRKNLSPLQRTTNIFLGRQVPNEVQGSSPFAILTPAGPASAVSVASRVGSTSYSTLPRVSRFLGVGTRTTRLAQAGKRGAQASTLLKQTAVTIGGGWAIAEGTKQIGILSTPKDIRKSLQEQGLSIRDVEKEVFIAGRTAQKQTAFGTGKGVNVFGGKLTSRGLATELNLLLGGKQAQESFRQQATLKGVEFGLTSEQASRLAIRQQKFRGFGELGGILGVNVGSEFIGTGLISGSKLFIKGATGLTGKEARSKLFKTGFFQIGKAGVVEGVGDVLVTRSSRNEPATFRSLAIGASVGGLSAGLLGGGIVATQAGRKGTSKALYVVGSIADPFEFPADKTADILRKNFKIFNQKQSVLGTTRKGGVELFDISPRKRFTSKTRGFSTAPFSQTNKPVSTKNQFFTGSFVPSFTPVSALGTRTPVSALGTKTPVGSFTRSNTFTGVFSTSTPINIFGDRSRTTTTTPTSITSFANVPVSIPRALLPPPILPFGIPSGSSSGTGKKQRSKFIDELSIARSLIQLPKARINKGVKKGKRK